MFVPRLINHEDASISNNISEDDFNVLVKKTIQALMIMGQKGNPIKKADLNKLVFPHISYKSAAAIVQVANKELQDVFGMRLFEVEDKTKFLLVNDEPQKPLINHLTDEDCEELTALHFILLGIFASTDERIAEEEIIKALSPLKIDPKRAELYLTSFVKRLYLKQEKHKDKSCYIWGPRAVAEVDPEKFFTQLEELLGTNQDWTEQKRRLGKLKEIHSRKRD